MNVHDDARRSKEHIRGNGFNQDAGKGDGAGCDCAFFLRTAAESSVIARPTGKGSMKVISELKSAFSYCSLSFFSCWGNPGVGRGQSLWVQRSVTLLLDAQVAQK